MFPHCYTNTRSIIVKYLNRKNINLPMFVKLATVFVIVFFRSRLCFTAAWFLSVYYRTVHYSCQKYLYGNNSNSKARLYISPKNIILYQIWLILKVVMKYAICISPSSFLPSHSLHFLTIFPGLCIQEVESLLQYSVLIASSFCSFRSFRMVYVISSS